MLLQACILSIIIAVLVASTHTSPSHEDRSGAISLAVKTFIISLLVIYFGVPYLIPAIASHIGGGQVIEMGDPDF